MRRSPALLAAACLAGTLVAGAAGATTPADAAPAYVSARTLLAALPVQEELRDKEYDPERFDYGTDYDADNDGCDTRKEVLLRDAVRITYKSKSCALRGTWKSLYDDAVTDEPLDFTLDRLVQLKEAWRSGAYRWSNRRGAAFTNDLGYRWSIIAVSAGLNGERANVDPSGWLPPKNRCTYVKAWIAVKYRWKLAVDPTEKAGLVQQLAKCTDLKVLKPGKPNIGRLIGHGPA